MNTSTRKEAVKIVKFVVLITSTFLLGILAYDVAFGVQHSIDIDMNEETVLVDYSSPDSLSTIVIMLEFDGCVPVKANWGSSIPNTKLDFINIDGDQVVAVCFGIIPRIKPGKKLNLLVIHLSESPSNYCNVDTFVNKVGSRTCMCMLDGRIIYPEINFNFTGVEDETEEGILPKEYSLPQNFPNPFNPSTVITFTLPTESYVDLAVYNLLGQKVEILVAKELSAGVYTVDWNADNFASGIYFLRFEAVDFEKSYKMVLMK